MSIFAVIVPLVSIALLVFLDQWVKIWVDHHFALNEFREFLQIGSLDLFHLRYVQNNGAAFSSFAGQRVFLVGISLVMIAFCIWYYIRQGKNSRFLRVGLILLIGGGIGNLIDRIQNGYVIDYLDFQLFNFAVFNLADIFVCCGIGILLVYELFLHKENPS